MSELIKDVHTEHCCKIHGCKYGKDDVCTVITDKAPQSFVCENCECDGITNLKILNAVLKGKIRLCPHCGHTLST
jgi:hypothetical protein